MEKGDRKEQATRRNSEEFFYVIPGDSYVIRGSGVMIVAQGSVGRAQISSGCQVWHLDI